MTADTRLGSLDHAIGADGLLVIRLDDGDLDLRGVDGDTVRVRSMDGRSMASVEVERGDGSLTVTSGQATHAREPGSRPRSGRADLLVEVPTRATVVVEASSAEITAEGLTGQQQLRTASGDLVVRDVQGSLTAEAVSGDVAIEARGPLELAARTVSGDMQITAPTLRSLRATTTSGDMTIAAAFDGHGPFSIESISGDTSLEPIGDVVVEVTTLTGDVHAPGLDRRSRDEGRIVVGSGAGPTISFRSTSGDLAITPRAAHKPTIRISAKPEPEAMEREPSIDRAPADQADEADATMDVLHALENGDIDVAEASRRLAATDADDGGATTTARDEVRIDA
jgi:Putative adhesin